MRQGPLAGRYPAVAAMVMCALIPYLALSAALGPLTPIISAQFHASAQTMSLGGGLGNAAYALGTVLAVQFAQHFPQRRMLLGYAVMLVVGSLLQAFAQNTGMFLAGHIVQGLCTSLLLIAAVPPLAIGFPKDKLRDTAVIMNMCIFGAVALGPLVGGVQAEAHAWRPLFYIIAGISVLALLLAILTFEDAPPANPDSPTDLPAIGLAAVGCIAAFFGASELTSHPFVSTITLLPLAGGLLVIVILVVYQCTAPRPLLTIRPMFQSSIPVAGIIVALSAAAASVSATDLTVTVLAPHYSSAHIGILYLPEVGGAVLMAIAMGIAITRRSLHFLPLFGMACLAAGIVVFRIHVPSTETSTLIGAGLTGLGLGATVAPALFVAGFSLSAPSLQRVFAIVELLRAVAAFMIAPIFAHFADTVGGNVVKGTGIALWIGLGIAVAGAVVAVMIYWLSGAKPQTPDIDKFLDGGEPGWHSPLLLARVRGIPVSQAVVMPAAPPVITGALPAGMTAEEAHHMAVSGEAPLHDAAPAAVTDSDHAHEHPLEEPVETGSTNGSSATPAFTLHPTNGNGHNHEHDGDGLVLFAYDGSELAKNAIEQAGIQLQPGREALILTVWCPANVGFQPVGEQHFDADKAPEVHHAAELTAAQGVALAEQAGFKAHAATLELNETWKGIIATAERHEASLIVMGSHRHSGLAGHLAGSVASSVVTHSKAPVLVIHKPE